MARRILNPTFPSSRKEEASHFSAHFRKSSQIVCSPRSHRSSHSPCHHRSSTARTFPLKRSPRSSQPVPKDMTIDISPTLRRWLHDKGLAGYIRVAEAPPHTNVQEMARKLNIDTITNASIRKKLGLSRTGEHHFEIAPAKALEQ